MARKRGGIAGFYDKNKKAIKTIAPIAAGFIPGVGPLIGAGLGAALGGDTEGKGYFKGFNKSGALLGGASGYAGAKLGQAAKGGIGNMFTGGGVPGMSAGKLPSATSVMPGGLSDDVIMRGGNMASNSRFGLDSLGKLFGKEGFIEQNKTVLSGLGKGVMGVREGARAEEEARLNREENARQFNEAQSLRTRQQGNLDQEAMMTKQQFDELNANRARLRAILTGGM